MAAKDLKKWLTGAEVMGQWNLRPFELLECLRKGLPVYNKNTLWPYLDDVRHEEISMQLAHPIDIPYHRVGDYSELSSDLANCVFLQEKVELFADEHNLERADPPTQDGREEKQTFPDAEAPIVQEENAFLLQGDYWNIVYRGEKIPPVKNTKEIVEKVFFPERYFLMFCL